MSQVQRESHDCIKEYIEKNNHDNFADVLADLIHAINHAGGNFKEILTLAQKYCKDDLENESSEKDTEPTFTNFYRHCGVEWQDTWTAKSDDECPVCKKDIEPYKSE
jgi:hypothetical protein